MIPKPQQPQTVEEQIAEIRFELLLYGFAAVKKISELTKTPVGRIDCPLCGRRKGVAFGTAPGNGHFRAHCLTDQCINVME